MAGLCEGGNELPGSLKATVNSISRIVSNALVKCRTSHSPVLGGGGAVPLPAVLEPVADLRRGEPRGLRQLALLGGVGVRVLQVPLPQEAPGALLEAVRLLLAVPDRPGQRELLPHAVLVHGPQGPAAQLLGLLVVRLQPHGLQLAVRLLGELVVLQDGVHVPEVAAVEGHDGSRAQHGLVLVELGHVGVRDGQRPQEARQALDVAGLLQRLAHGGHLRHREVERRQREHRAGDDGRRGRRHHDGRRAAPGRRRGRRQRSHRGRRRRRRGSQPLGVQAAQPEGHRVGHGAALARLVQVVRRRRRGLLSGIHGEHGGAGRLLASGTQVLSSAHSPPGGRHHGLSVSRLIKTPSVTASLINGIAPARASPLPRARGGALGRTAPP
ncbi:hypothetical protein ANN_11365 [Periplaneta americana]|uniref:Uncharacterized protein n=1 Tax=Periplaneta americana TaxID=6978 RepID=A0ABQ8T4T2_PERAM|nr:hypothetical protein ANN_11365 [Periplaneta americana]